MKLFSIFNREIHDHHVVLLVFASMITITYFNVNHANNNNCHLLEPDINCDQRGVITRYQIVATIPNYVFINHTISLYGLDEYRGVAPSTFHAECTQDSQICNYHYDLYNGVVGPFSIFDSIAHTADTVSTLCWNEFFVALKFNYQCNGIPDSWAVLLIWSAIIFGGYYPIKHLVLYLRKHLK